MAEWTDAQIAQLRVLWDLKLSTAEIGRRMGMSKNGIVGKAHRMGLAGRPCPIRLSGEPRKPRARRTAGPTLPPLASAAVPDWRIAARTAILPPAAPKQPSLKAAIGISDRHARRPDGGIGAPEMTLHSVVHNSPRVLEKRAGTAQTCCWPIGDPGTRAFRFCDDAAVTGRPYCRSHCEVAYVTVRDRREDAAA